MLLSLVVTSLLVLSVTVPFVCYFRGPKTKKRFANAVLSNGLAFFGTLALTTVFLFANYAFASGDAGAATAASNGWMYLAAALSTGIGSIGAGIAVAAAASSAIGAISENEAIFGKTLVFVGLAEGIAIYGLLVSLIILFS